MKCQNALNYPSTPLQAKDNGIIISIWKEISVSTLEVESEAQIHRDKMATLLNLLN